MNVYGDQWRITYCCAPAIYCIACEYCYGYVESIGCTIKISYKKCAWCIFQLDKSAVAKHNIELGWWLQRYYSTGSDYMLHRLSIELRTSVWDVLLSQQWNLTTILFQWSTANSEQLLGAMGRSISTRQHPRNVPCWETQIVAKVGCVPAWLCSLFSHWPTPTQEDWIPWVTSTFRQGTTMSPSTSAPVKDKQTLSKTLQIHYMLTH